VRCGSWAVSAQRARPAAPASNAQLQHVWCAALDGMLSGGARRAPKIIMCTTSCTTHRTRPPRGGCWAGLGRAAQRQLLLLLLNGGCCCCCCSTLAVAARSCCRAGPCCPTAAVGGAAAAQRRLLVLVLLLLLPGRAVLVNQSSSSRLRRRAVRGATGATRCAYLRRPPHTARKHTL
jgi:hypothetical protein